MMYALALALASAGTALASCDCYAINTTDSQYSGLFTNILETDFLHASNVTYGGVASTGWVPQIYNMTANQSRGEYGRANLLENIVANPLPPGVWKDTSGRNDPGLQLWVRSEIQDGFVPTAELALPRDDVLYGSFRIGMKVTGINGTCSAFFWYHDDTQEIDTEVLSKNQSIVHQIIQTPDAEANGFNAAGTPDSKQWNSVYSLPQDYHEYRFDWLPDRVQFYLDGMLTFILTDDIPDSPGHLLLSHWSNGNMGWSMGPPEEDAVMAVSYIKAYFNTTGSRNATKPACKAVCVVPEQMNPPDPSNGETPFFTLPSGSGTADAPVSSVSSPPHGRTNSAVSEAESMTLLKEGSGWRTCGCILIGVLLHLLSS